MNKRLIIQGAMLILTGLGKEPSVRNVAELIEPHNGGRGFRWSDIRAEMILVERHLAARATVGQQPGNSDTSQLPSKMGVSADGGQQQGRLRARAQISKELSKWDTDPSISLGLFTDSLRSSGDSGEGEPEKSDAKSKQQLPWVAALREAARLIADTALCNLTLEERLVVGRYHAYRFANCTKSEARNRSAGAKAAVAFAKMADSAIFADFTVREYCDHMAVYVQDFLRGAPCHDPFAIRAVLEARKDRTAGGRR